MERKYGGRLRAHTAATRIQRAYRHYRLKQQWHQLIKAQLFQPVILNPNYNSQKIKKLIQIETLKIQNSETISHFKKLDQSHTLLKFV